MRARRTLPTIRHLRPLWWRLGRELVRLAALWWHSTRRRSVVEEERGYRQSGRINGYRIGPNYLHNCRAQRKELRAKIADWKR